MREIPDGVISMMVTPTHDDAHRTINFGAFYDEIDWCVEQGAKGIVVTPSIGEFAALTESERKECLETCKAYLEEEHPEIFTIAGIAETSTDQAEFYAQYAKDLGYDAGQINPPYYWVPDDEEVEEYYRDVAKVALPLVVYNNPRLSKVDLYPKLMARLVQIPGVIAIKEIKTDRHVDLEPLFKEVKGTNPLVKVYTTFRAFADGLHLGANGCFSHPFATPFCVKIWNIWQSALTRGELESIDPIQTALNEVFPRGGEHSKRHIGTTKMATSVIMKKNMGLPKRPYRYPDPRYKKQLREKLPELYELIK